MNANIGTCPPPPDAHHLIHKKNTDTERSCLLYNHCSCSLICPEFNRTLRLYSSFCTPHDYSTQPAETPQQAFPPGTVSRTSVQLHNPNMNKYNNSRIPSTSTNTHKHLRSLPKRISPSAATLPACTCHAYPGIREQRRTHKQNMHRARIQKEHKVSHISVYIYIYKCILRRIPDNLNTYEKTPTTRTTPQKRHLLSMNE